MSIGTAKQWRQITRRQDCELRASKPQPQGTVSPKVPGLFFLPSQAYLGLHQLSPEARLVHPRLHAAAASQLVSATSNRCVDTEGELSKRIFASLKRAVLPHTKTNPDGQNSPIPVGPCKTLGRSGITVQRALCVNAPWIQEK